MSDEMLKDDELESVSGGAGRPNSLAGLRQSVAASSATATNRSSAPAPTTPPGITIVPKTGGANTRR